jgi:integrase
MRKLSKGSYLIQIGNIYYFRYLVPEQLTEVFGQKVIKKSLNIRYVKQARKLALHLVVTCHEVFRFFSFEGVKMDQHQAKAILFQYLEDKLRQWTIFHAERPVLSDEQLRLEIQAIKNQAELMQAKMNKADFLDVIPDAKELMDSNHIKNDDYNLKEICYNITKMNKTFFDIIDKRLAGNYIYEESILNRLAPNNQIQHVYVQPPKEEIKDAPLYSVLIEKYISEMTPNWSRQTFEECSRIYRNTFLKSIDDVPANRYTLQDFLNLRDKLAEREGLFGNKISKSRLTAIDKRISSFFNWCVARDYMAVNFATKVKLKRSKREGSKRQPFNKEDLELIFSQSWFTDPEATFPEKFWLPLLAYYTGARLGELVQLNKEDLIHNKEKGYWVIDINENDGKEIKTEYSIRSIPIHPDLIEIGFGRFVESSNYGRIFPTTSKEPAKVFGSSFSKFKTELGFDQYKVFHSFRHTFSNRLKQCMINDLISDEYTGHSNPSMTKGVYSNKFEQDVYWENLVCKIEFEIRFNHLSWPKFTKAQLTRKKSRQGRKLSANPVKPRKRKKRV